MLRLSELRDIKGITQKELADALGVKNYTVGNWEQGRSEPSLRDLEGLSDFFECSTDYLLGREDDFGNVVIDACLTAEQAKALDLFSRLPTEKREMVTELMADILEAVRSRNGSENKQSKK